MEHKFYILESLRESDSKTGKELYNTFKEKADFEYLPFDSRQKLFDILNYIRLDITATKKKPFIHFDCHGNEDGIGVVNLDKSEELVEWRQISETFRQIYRNSNKRSVLCMSSCNGFNAVKIVTEKNTCPYDYVSGSFESISFEDSFEGYKKFYELVLQNNELVKAGIQVHNTFEKLKFVCLSSSQLFELAEKGYLETRRIPELVTKEKAITIQNVKNTVGKLTAEITEYIDYKYSDAGIAEYLQDWRKVFFS